MNNKTEKEIWVFLSHSLKDFEKVRRVRNMLEEQNLRPLMFFLKCMEDTDVKELDNLIKREIDCRTRFILCDSPNARSSTWVRREIDYIKSKEKPFEIIDLAKSDEEILKQLEEFKRRTNLYISYSRHDRELAKRIYERLQKYDFNVFIDYESITSGNFAEQVKDMISNSVDNGYVISLLTDSALKSRFVCGEIEYAKQIGEDKRILSVLLTNQQTSIVNGTTIIRPLNESFEDADAICDTIIQSLFCPSEILTYYRNFKNGTNANGYEYEAERLGKLYYNWARKSDEENRPSGVISLGLCYEEGIGVEINLQKAYEQYQDPVSTDGCARDMAKRVYAKLHPDIERHDVSPSKSTFGHKIRFLCHLIFIEMPQDLKNILFPKKQ